MALTKEDLQAIADLMDVKIGASEQRLKAYIESHVEKEIRQIADGHKMLYEKMERDVPFPVSWTVKMKKKQKETQDILSYHSQAAGCSDKARAKASGGRQPIEECGRTGL